MTRPPWKSTRSPERIAELKQQASESYANYLADIAARDEADRRAAAETARREAAGAQVVNLRGLRPEIDAEAVQQAPDALEYLQRVNDQHWRTPRDGRQEGVPGVVAKSRREMAPLEFIRGCGVVYSKPVSHWLRYDPAANVDHYINTFEYHLLRIPPHEAVDRVKAAQAKWREGQKKQIQYTDMESPILPSPVLVDGYLRIGEIANLVASPKVGKTMCILWLAVAVALGLKWMGRQCASGRVLLIDDECHEWLILERIQQVCKALGVDPAEALKNIDVWSLRGTGQLTLDQIDQHLTTDLRGKWSLVILDAIYRCYPANFDENDNAAWTALFNRLDGTARRLNCAVQIVHHLGKGGAAFRTVTDSGSGAGAMSRAADTHARLVQHEAEGHVVFDHVSRSFPAPSPTVWHFNWPLFVSADYMDAGALKTTQKANGGEHWTPDRFTKQFITTTPKTTAAIEADARQCGLSKASARSLLTRAVDEGLCQRLGGSGATPAKYAITNGPTFNAFA